MSNFFTIKRRDVHFISLVLIAYAFDKLLDHYQLNFLSSTIVAFAVHYVANGRSSIHLMTLVGYATFIYAPAILNGFFFDTSFDLFYVTSFLTYVLLRKTEECRDKNFEGRRLSFVLIFVAYSLAIVAASLMQLSVSYLFLISPCVMFFVLSMRRAEGTANMLLAALFLFTFGIYFVYGWTGYGRTVTFGNLIVAVLLLMHVNNFRVNKYLLSGLSIVGSLLLVARKSLDAADISSLEFLNDSAVGPYRLAVTFIESYELRGVDLYGFFDQVLFTLFSFVPRELWDSKPFGFGFVYVVDNLEQYLADSGHSIASTLFGDHIYYLGPLGLVSGFVMIHIISWVINRIYGSNVFGGGLYILISCNMMVLLWGGMTSFSARIIFPLIGVLPFIVLHYFMKLTKLRRVG